MRIATLKLVLSVIAVSAVTMLGAGPATAVDPCGNKTFNLHLDSGGGLSDSPPPPGIAAFVDSPALTRANGWQEVSNFWAGNVDPTATCFAIFSDLHLWLGLRNSDDQGTNFDVLVEMSVNGLPAGSKEFDCIKGLTRNPALAYELKNAGGFAGGNALPGNNDFAVKVSARIAAPSCGGHNSATGLRLYYDSDTRDSRFHVLVTGPD